MGTSIPSRVQDLDVARVAGYLDRSGVTGDATLVDVRVEPLGAEEGLVSEVSRLRLTFDRDDTVAPRSLIAKLPAPYGPRRALGEASRGYERECLFYRDLAERVPVPVPRAYACEFDAFPLEGLDRIARGALESLPEFARSRLLPLMLRVAERPVRRSFLLLEDLGPSTVDPETGFDPECARTALEAGARLHARFWRGRDLERLTWIRTIDETPHAFGTLFARAWRRFADGPGRALELPLEPLERFLDAHAVRLARHLASAPCTLTHGDYRLENLVFSGRELVGVLDWQAVVLAPAALDVAYFLGSSLEPDPEVERELIEGYHRSLLEGGVERYSLDRLRAHERLARLLVLHRVVVAFASLPIDRDPESRQAVSRWLRRLGARLRRLDLVRAEADLDSG